MSPSMQSVTVPTPRTKYEPLHLSPAKVKLTGRENRPRVGAAFKRAMDIVGLDVKQTAVLLGFVDDQTGEVKHAQVSRWIAGTEAIQLDRIYGTKLHGPFAIEQARDDDSTTVETTVTWRAR
jgi:hypothetical protein